MGSYSIILTPEMRGTYAQRKLGEEGLEVSAISLGTMMMPDNDESVRTIQGALDMGVTMFDTADLYGTEYMLGRFGEMKACRTFA